MKKHIQWEVNALNFHHYGQVSYFEDGEMVIKKSDLFSSPEDAENWVKAELGISKPETKNKTEKPETAPVEPDNQPGDENENN